MKDEELEQALERLKPAINLAVNLSPRQKVDIDEIEIVFMDMVNGRPKHRRAFTFIDIVSSLVDRGLVAGILLLPWDNPDKVSSIAVVGASDNMLEQLSHAMAEAQDEMKSIVNDVEDDE